MRKARRCDSSLQELAALLLHLDWTCLLHCRGQGLADMSEYELDHLLQQSLADTPKQAGGCDVPAPNALRGARVSASQSCLLRFPPSVLGQPAQTVRGPMLPKQQLTIC